MPFDGAIFEIGTPPTRGWRAEAEATLARLRQRDEQRRATLSRLTPTARALIVGIDQPPQYDPHADLDSPIEALPALQSVLSPKQRRALLGEWTRRTRRHDSETHAADSLYAEIVVPLATTERFRVSADPEARQRAVLEHLACGYDSTRIWALACALSDAAVADLAAVPESEWTPDQRRQSDPAFHARAIKRRARFARAHADVVLGLVGGRRGRAVVSDECAQAHAEQQKRTREWLAGSYAVPLDEHGAPTGGNGILLSDAADRARAARNARRYTQALGREDVARRLGWRTLFVTLTLPAEYHVGATRGRRGDPKNTAEHAARAMQSMWHSAVNIWQKWKIPHFADVATEFHESGTLHRHVIAAVPPERIDDAVTALTGGPLPEAECDGCRRGAYTDDWNIGPWRADVRHTAPADSLRVQAQAVRSEIRALLTHSRGALAEWTRDNATEMSALHGGTKAEARSRWHAQHLALVARERVLLEAAAEAADGAVRAAFAASRVNVRVLQPAGDVLLDRTGRPMLDANGEPKRAASLASYILPYLNPDLSPDYAAAAWAQGVRRSSVVGMRPGLQADWHYLYTSAPERLTDMPLAQHVATALAEKRYGDALLDVRAFTSVGIAADDAEGPTHLLQPVRDERVGGYGEPYWRRVGLAEVTAEADADCPHYWRRDYGVESTRPFQPPAVTPQLGAIRRGGLYALVTETQHAILTGDAADSRANVAACLQAQHADKIARRCERSRTNTADLYTRGWATLDLRLHTAPPLPLPPPSPVGPEPTDADPEDPTAADVLATVRAVFPAARLVYVRDATPDSDPLVQLGLSHTRVGDPDGPPLPD